MNKFQTLEEEVYMTLLRYANVIDRMYNLDENFRKAIIEHFGTSHSPMVIDAVNWQAAKLAQHKLLEESQKKIDANGNSSPSG